MNIKNSNELGLKVHHCGISVPDIDASIKWYTDMLGFSLKQKMFVESIGAKVAFLDLDGFQIELFEVKDASPMSDDRRYPNKDIRTHGTKHFSFIVDDLDDAAAVLKRRGVDFAMDITEMPDGKTIFIRDNSGILVEIMEVYPS